MQKQNDIQYAKCMAESGHRICSLLSRLVWRFSPECTDYLA